MRAPTVRPQPQGFSLFRPKPSEGRTQADLAPPLHADIATHLAVGQVVATRGMDVCRSRRPGAAEPCPTFSDLQEDRAWT